MPSVGLQLLQDQESHAAPTEPARRPWSSTVMVVCRLQLGGFPWEAGWRVEGLWMGLPHCCWLGVRVANAPLLRDPNCQGHA